METKRKIYLLTVLILFSLLIIQNACKKDEEENEPISPSIPSLNEYTLNNNVTILDSLSTPDPIVEGEKYTFNYTTTPPDFKIGDIVIGYTNGGYIMKIVSIEKSGKSTNFVIILHLVQALFEEVFSECNFDITIPIVSTEKSLDNTILFDKQVGNVDFEVLIQDGYISTDLELNFKLIRFDGETILFSLVAYGGVYLETDTKFTSNGYVMYGDEILILPPLIYGFSIGPVPAQAFLGFYGGFNAEISVDGSLSYKCLANGEIEYGAEYTNSEGWNEVWEKSGEFTNEEVNWDLSFNALAEVYVKPEIKLLVCGIAGPIMNIKPYLNFEASANYPQWAWELNGGYTGNIGFELNLLGFFEIIEYSTPLAQWETQIDSETGQVIAGWEDDFESYSVGTFPSSWDPDGNATSSSNYIDDIYFFEGNQSLKLYGTVGGCWAAITYHSISTSPPYTVEFAVRNGNESLSGCHPERGGVGLRNGTYWSNPSRSFILFGGDGKIYSGGNNHLIDYNTETWYIVKIKYEIISSSEVKLSYYVNNNFIGDEILPKKSYEDQLDHLEIASQEGSVWFDSIKVYNE